MPTGASLPLIRLPGFEWPANATLNFQPLERALTRHQESQFQLARLERDDQRLGLERDRFGLDTRRFESDERYRTGQAGRDTARLGLERDSFGLRRDEAEWQEQERRSVRLGNMAFGVRNRSDRTARSADAIRLIWETPGVAELLAREGGFRLNREYSTVEDYDRALDFLINRPLTPRQENIPHGPPGTGFFRVETGDGGERRLTPIGQVPERRPPLSDAVITRLGEEGNRIANTSRLHQTWDDAFTMPGGVSPLVGGGDLRNWFGRHYSNAPDTARRAAQWWQDYQRSSELIERHGLFGAALTAPELAAWRAATITPNMTPEAIRRNLQTQRDLVERRTRNHAQALILQGHDPRVIGAALGIDPRVLLQGGGGDTTTQPPPAGQPPPTTTTTPGQTPPSGRQPPPAHPPGPIPEGTVIRNANGQRMILRNGQWQPLE